MPLKWTFPPIGGGVEFGFHDSGQEHFRAGPWENAIREMIQNSLDAVKDAQKPVTVDISTSDVPSSEIGARALARHMQKSLEYTKQQDDQEGVKFYKNALAILKRRKIRTLAIRDGNTTGLVGAKWDALIYKEGTPNKSGTSAAGGSFGIGKNAPYLVSALKTVFYSTRYLHKGRRELSIGRCKITAHQSPDKPGEKLQHVGFGTAARHKPDTRAPPSEGREIYGGFRLDSVGSGIFVIGFDPQSDDWVGRAKISIARSFFAAIHEQKLQITIESEKIDHETLDGIFEERGGGREHHYYRVICDSKTQTRRISGDFGRFTVQLGTGADGSPNRAAYINNRGMLVTDAGQFGSNPFHSSVGLGYAKYAAVVRAADDETDEKVRRMEPPNHKAIEYRRITDSAERKVLRAQLERVRGQIAQLIRAEVQSCAATETHLSELAGIMSLEDGQLEHHVMEHRQIEPPPEPAPVTGGGGRGGTGKPPGRPGNGERRPREQTIRNTRAMPNGGKLRVAFTPAEAGASVRFVVKPAGEEQKHERAMRVDGARVVSPPGAEVRVDGGIMTVSPNSGERVVVDLAVGERGYTGYHVLEYGGDENDA